MDYTGTVCQHGAVAFVQQRIKAVTLASLNAKPLAFRCGVFARGRARATALGLDLSAGATLFNRNTILKMTSHVAEGSL